MYPLDFEEFLWAKGDEATMPALWTFFRRQMPLGQALHRVSEVSFGIACPRRITGPRW